uniref:Anaphase-promoting complex subunit 4 WD40 domain-containing protein n=1 Tax=Tetradesmus obliquus TaxID=3088 RepID=A0A383W1Z6_TETOB|eukprot:jgi/Sobl393_1/5179/SZX71064.1
MSLTCSSSHKPGLIHIAFNQDNSCICIGTSEGIRIYHIETHQICYRDDIGAVGIAEMLFCTSLLVYVGAGDQPSLTPRRLSVINTSSSSVIRDLSFSSSVLAVRLNKQRLVAVLDGRVHVHALQTLAQLRIIETPPNPKGLAALTPCSEPCCYLALPASAAAGVLRVYDLLVDGGHVVCEVQAHKAPLAAMAWSHDGAFLATASSTGTVIRVYSMPHASKAYSFRRGTYPAAVHCLAFSPEGYQPPLLAAASSHGTIHLFRLEQPHRSAAAAAASAAAGLLSAVINFAVTDMVEPQRSIANIRLPCAGLPAICALQHPTGSSGNAFEGGGGASSLSGQSDVATLPEDADEVTLVVATAGGLLYEYAVEQLSSAAGPKASLGGEWTLLGSTGLAAGA